MGTTCPILNYSKAGLPEGSVAVIFFSCKGYDYTGKQGGYRSFETAVECFVRDLVIIWFLFCYLNTLLYLYHICQPYFLDCRRSRGTWRVGHYFLILLEFGRGKVV
jgi:hypothetical protein